MEEVASSTLAYYFERPASFQFSPGQFVELALKDAAPADPYRTFSIASSPAEPDLMIATRNRASQFKQALKILSTGTDVQVDGPYGKLHVVPDTSLQHVFIAGGIGITPFRSMLLDLGAKADAGRVTLFYSNKDVASAAFLPELEELSRAVPSFRLITTFSASGAEARGEKGRVDEAMIGRYLDPSTARFYVSGPSAMVTSMKTMLAAMGVPADRVQSEAFAGY